LVAVFSSISSTSAIVLVGTPFAKSMPIFRARTSLSSSVTARPATERFTAGRFFVLRVVTPSAVAASSLPLGVTMGVASQVTKNLV